MENIEEVKVYTNVNGNVYHRIQSVHDKIDDYLKEMVEMQAAMNCVNLNWDTMVFTEHETAINGKKCGDSLTVTLTVKTI